MTDQEFWYRYVDQRWSVTIDPEREIYGTRLEVCLRKYEVLRHTEKGVWIKDWDGSERFVLKEARKRFACPTQKEAIESYIARKDRQIRIYSTRLDQAKSFKSDAEEILTSLECAEQFIGTV